jgi:hypothetical protein
MASVSPIEPPFHPTFRQVWALVAPIAGVALVIVGLVLLVLPGPGTPLVILGLSLLSSRLPWARRILHRLRALVRSAAGPGPGPRQGGGGPPGPGPGGAAPGPGGPPGLP